MNEAILLNWIESERGWGQRSDGCSIHLTEEDAKAFVKEYNEDLPEEVPDEYSRPDSGPQKVVISDKLYEKLTDSDNGIRLWQSEFRDNKDKNEILFKQ